MRIVHGNGMYGPNKLVYTMDRFLLFFYFKWEKYLHIHTLRKSNPFRIYITIFKCMPNPRFYVTKLLVEIEP